MTTEKTDGPEGSEAVIAFLREHPDLLVDHPDLLSEMTIPHTTGVATSLVERQVSVLREQVRQHKHQLNELIQIATDNGQLSKRLHLLAVQLINSTNVEELISTIQKSLSSDFNADKVVLRFLADIETGSSSNNTLELVEFVGREWADRPLFEEVITNQKPLCGRLNSEQHQLLFSDELPEYGSAVVLPLSGKSWQGLLAIGSQNPERYQKDMGTEILTQLGDLITLAIAPFVSKT